MSLANAERVFARLVGAPPQESHDELQHLLRDLLMRLRVVNDSGLTHRELYEQDARRRARGTARALAVQRGALSAVGMATLPEHVFGDPLPVSDRWGDVFATTIGGPVGPVHVVQVLGLHGRPTLPHAAAATGRCGPHATPHSQLQTPSEACVSYADIVADLDATAQGKAVTGALAKATHMGVELLHTDADTDIRDHVALGEDGARAWPPRLVTSRAENAPGVVRLLLAMSKQVSEQTPPPDACPQRQSKGFGGVDVYRKACNDTFIRDDVSQIELVDLAELGVCITNMRAVKGLRDAQQRALHAAVAAHAASLLPLANALETVADSIGLCM